MINSMQMALIKKDIRSITTNKRLFPVLIIVPLVMTVFLPTIFIFATAFSQTESEGFSSLVRLLSPAMRQGDAKVALVSMILNSIIPLFFLIIPLMAASVMAASSFVGEKEKRTLETLLYCPLTLRQIFDAKVWASFALSMAVSLLSFLAMVVVVEIEAVLVLGAWIPPGISWLVMLVLVSPAISIIAVTIIVRGSAKAQTVEESQQRSAFLVLPIVILAAGQFSGIMLINAWMLLAAGVVFALIAWLLMRKAFAKFNYETLLD